jgi:hypothetical protein
MDIIINALRVGSSRVAAIARTAIDKDTYSEWLKRFPTFAWEVVQAEAAVEITLVQIVTSRKPGWQAAAWQLERRYPDRWSKREPPPPEQREAIIHVVYDDMPDPERFNDPPAHPWRCPRCGWSQRSDVDTEKGAQGEGRGELSTVVRPELESVIPTGESGGAQHQDVQRERDPDSKD